jgi:hypothetical protein
MKSLWLFISRTDTYVVVLNVQLRCDIGLKYEMIFYCDIAIEYLYFSVRYRISESLLASSATRDPLNRSIITPSSSPARPEESLRQ